MSDMMQTLVVQKLNQIVRNAVDIPAVFHSSGIVYTPVSNANWPANFPYKPKVYFGAAHTGDALLLHYRVEEQSVRAVAQRDQEHIWEDSCAEFFFMPVDDGLYYNIECNCTGKLLVAVGRGRGERKPAPIEVMRNIDRWASLGSGSFDVRREPTAWELALRVPVADFFLHSLKSLDGLKARGNVYKCGDRLPVPHFISWNPIKTETPDFHRPEFFGEIIFE